MKKLLIFVLCMLAAPAIMATDLAKEQRWKDQVVGDLFDGEPVSLNDGKNEFLGLLTLADPAGSRAVIVLHGVGVHPDWPQIINPMRVRLAEDGMTTLSIQLPILENEAEAEAYDAIIGDAAPRIAAAYDYLAAQGAEDIFIVAHSMGSRMAADYLAATDQAVKGFVAVGMNVGGVQYLDRISVPMLDIYGSNDLEGVLASAQDRANASAANPDYSQQVVEGADHFFNEMQEALYDRVKPWLDQH